MSENSKARGSITEVTLTSGELFAAKTDRFTVQNFIFGMISKAHHEKLN